SKAAPAMQQAAKSLQQSAALADKQLKPAQRVTPVTGKNPGGAGFSGVPASLLPKEAKHLAGRPWGELPGELRSRIIQDVRARFGDDYARIIQGYYEAIADPRGVDK